ncbi:MAG: serine hydrolase domain-containing protein [Pseudomonadota bacterium]
MLSTSVTHGDGPAAILETESGSTEALSTLEGLEPFVDGAVTTAMTANDIPGTIISIVHHGDVVLSKGYGYADQERTIPATGESTRFSVASISKTFVWTSVMQLVEQGKLDLDVDVNTYLTQFQIPASFEQPVTLRHIFAHTAGFEDRVIGLFRKDLDLMHGSAESLSYYIPERVRPPGQYAAYSNWASALAGLIVSNVSGVPFNQYVAENVLNPLGMSHSTFVEPLPDTLPGETSGAFRRTSGENIDDGYIYSDLGPAAALSATAADIAKFMIAHLGDGTYNGQRILSEDSVRRMREPTHRHHPAIDASLHGFREYTHNGRFTYGHGGNHAYFHSTLVMMPEDSLGLFISTNALNAKPALAQIKRAFFDRYYPRATENKVSNLSLAGAASSDDFVGSYRSTRRNYSTWARVFSIVTADTSVTTAARGGLVYKGERYIPTAKDVFTSLENPDHVIAFQRNEKGVVTHMFDSPWRALETVPVSTSTTLHGVIIGLGVLVMLALIAFGLWKLRLWRRAALTDKLAVGVIVLASAINIAFLALLLPTSESASLDLYFAGKPNLALLLAAPLLAAVLSAAGLAFGVHSWRQTRWTRLSRFGYLTATAILLAFSWSLNVWNLLGPWNA